MLPLALLLNPGQVALTPEQSQALTQAVSTHFGKYITIDALENSAQAAAKRLYVPAYGTEMMAQLLHAVADSRPNADVLEIGSGFTTPFLLSALHGGKANGNKTRVLVTVDDMSHAEHSTVHTNIRAVRGSLESPGRDTAPPDAFQMYGKGWTGINSEVRSPKSEVGLALRKYAGKGGFQGFGVIWVGRPLTLYYHLYYHIYYHLYYRTLNTWDGVDCLFSLSLPAFLAFYLI